MFRRKRSSDDDLDTLLEDLARYDMEEGEAYRFGSRRRNSSLQPVALMAITAVLACVTFFFLWQTVGHNFFDGRSASTTERTLIVGLSDVDATVTAVSPPSSTSLEAAWPPADPASIAATAPTAVPATPTPSHSPNFSELQGQALDLVNQDRQAHGLNPVIWDNLAATTATLHSEDMLQHGYFSHWNLQGFGPDHRYTLAGGQHIAAENLHIFSYTFSDGRGVPIENWPEIIERAQSGLMNSPGHRATILDPAHTHVGIGMAYDAAKGQFTLAQLFTRHYVQLTRPLPLQARLGEQITLQGEVVGATVNDALLNLAYEPFPEPLTVDFLNQTTTYRSTAVNVEAWLMSPQFE